MLIFSFACRNTLSRQNRNLCCQNSCDVKVNVCEVSLEMSRDSKNNFSYYVNNYSELLYPVILAFWSISIYTCRAISLFETVLDQKRRTSKFRYYRMHKLGEMVSQHSKIILEIAWYFQTKIWYSKEVWRDFSMAILWKCLNAEHLVYSRPCPAAGYLASMKVPYRASSHDISRCTLIRIYH